MILGLLLACRPEKADPPAQMDEEVVHPTLLVTADRKEEILSRLGREPYDLALAEVEAAAAAEHAEPDLEVWDHDAWGHNGEIAQNAAFLAWLLDDEAQAERAKEMLALLRDDFETNETWDVDIRMAHPLIGYTNALDLLLGTPWISEEEAQEAADKITTINRKFYERYVEIDTYRLIAFYYAQNNHPIRAASTMGYVALAFPDDPDAEKWASFALSELDYLWGPDGQYVQPDGGVSEGPFYYGFAWGVSTAFFLAYDNAADPDAEHARTCINRQTEEPWAGYPCAEGEPFVFENPLHSSLYQAAVDWSLALRMPDGSRPPLEDSYFNPFNGAALLTSQVEGGGRYRWDWESHLTDPYEMTHGMDLRAYHLAYLDDAVAAEEPPWTTRFLPDAGQAAFRTGWGADDLWLLLTAESGSARQTLHDHVDGTSFSLAAYGDYLAIDPGYYKPDELDNAVTADATSHSVILIDGQGAPDKGLLTDFGDADAFLENTHDGAAIEYAEARQSYEGTGIERSVILLRGRYFVIADRLATAETAARSHAWRLHAGAGYDLGGTFTLLSCAEGEGCGARIAQSSGGLDVHLASTAPGLSVQEPAFVAYEAPHVHQYDRDRSVGHHGVLDGVVAAVDPGFLAILAPYRVGDTGADGPLSVEALDLGEGAAGWLVTTAEGQDLVLLREPGAPRSFALPGGRAVETDGELLVLSLESDALALLARGSFATLDGLDRVSGSGPLIAREGG